MSTNQVYFLCTPIVETLNTYNKAEGTKLNRPVNLIEC